MICNWLKVISIASDSREFRKRTMMSHCMKKRIQMVAIGFEHQCVGSGLNLILIKEIRRC